MLRHPLHLFSRSILTRFARNVVLSALALAALLFTGNHLGLQMEMREMSHQPARTCAFMNMDAKMCAMTIVSHFSAWTNRFATTINALGTLALMALLVTFATLDDRNVSILFETLKSRPPNAAVVRLRQALLRWTDAFLVALSRGILKPKLFA